VKRALTVALVIILALPFAGCVSLNDSRSNPPIKIGSDRNNLSIGEGVDLGGCIIAVTEITSDSAKIRIQNTSQQKVTLDMNHFSARLIPTSVTGLNGSAIKLTKQKNGSSPIVTIGSGKIAISTAHFNSDKGIGAIVYNNSATWKTEAYIAAEKTVQDEESTAAEARTETETAAKKARQAKEAQVQPIRDACVGKPYDIVYKQLHNLGYQVQFILDSTGEDITEVVLSDMENGGQIFKGCVVVSMYVDVDNNDATIKFDYPENVNRKSDEAVLSDKLSKVQAIAAVRTYGEDQYPYGFTLNALYVKVTMQDADTWLVKGKCDISNAFGAEAKGRTFEANVTGTNSYPQVTYFAVF